MNRKQWLNLIESVAADMAHSYTVCKQMNSCTPGDVARADYLNNVHALACRHIAIEGHVPSLGMHPVHCIRVARQRLQQEVEKNPGRSPEVAAALAMLDRAMEKLPTA